jgi:DNA-directed RNA polymerase subunit RPC12/RpoP
MGLVKKEDLIGWEESGKYSCLGCGDSGEGKPLTKENFEEGDIVTCDQCGERIL